MPEVKPDKNPAGTIQVPAPEATSGAIVVVRDPKSEGLYVSNVWEVRMRTYRSEFSLLGSRSRVGWEYRVDLPARRSLFLRRPIREDVWIPEHRLQHVLKPGEAYRA